jgi:RNA polymerase sigma-70 factor (ECF subfamily)
MFEQTVLPHLDAAYNLARWLAGNEHDAEDIVQESCLRALRFFDGFRGGNARAWLLTIVRNTSYTFLTRRNPPVHVLPDDKLDAIEDESVNPELAMAVTDNIGKVREAVARLPAEFREVIVLREMEEHSYKEIADITGTPIGTVMSRLSRARRLLQQMLSAEQHVPGGKP